MSGTVHIRLKHPHGIIFDLANDRKVALKGSDFHLRGLEKGVLTCGFGKTQVKDTDWEEVLTTYPSMVEDLVRKGVLIYENDAASAEDHAQDNTEVRHGREPVDVKNDKTIKTEEAPAGEVA
ncbi:MULTISPECIES: hypothetical protein [Klebsiella pneumoniae complex]|uniref:hypothetical protein n=1 Tax=Klebsiella pneumoniae complex TaxID=3390273 RepID=UPI0013D26DBC|nr:MULTISPECIES: hypothetical protein [Klebsiella]MCS5748443.1 hypothetical protein [Klebsiella quasipneumoniae subsp. quasipneumoniae]BBR04685.1 hypothetical protein WP3S18C02_19550 [Klebsiella quasipneumoniae]HBX9997328.1 hypothetical protein [Klebsiella variicola]HCB0298286.1 hypothetical protein [Klebsiella pneumoniae]